MSKNKLLIALLGAHIACSALAQTPLTIQEWSLMQGELKRAEHANKVREERAKGADSSLPVVIDRTCDDDLQMSAVYGMGKNLRADFIYRGATVTLAPGGDADMGGWSVRELTPTRAVMVKRGKGGKDKSKTCPLYLSAGVRNFTAPVVSPFASSDVPVQVPPITAVGSPRAAEPSKPAAPAGAAK